MTECTRCGEMKPQAFFIQSSPSVSFGAVDITETPKIVISCKDCLSDEEIARFLAPVALFVVTTALRQSLENKKPEQEVIRHFEYISAYLRFRCGMETNERTKALRALDGLIEVRA